MNTFQKIQLGSQPIFTVEVYIISGDNVLLHKRSDTKKKFPGFWSLPGGHIEPNEEPLSAAIREVYEETGITLTPNDIKLKVVAMHSHVDRKELYVVFAFKAIINAMTPPNPPNEEGSSHWVSVADALKNKEVLEPVKRYFNHVLTNTPGILYNSSAWENSHILTVYSETLDQNH
jgi:8-oxo-dGTP pyrophosphatase MutT (NUDIX family)